MKVEYGKIVMGDTTRAVPVTVDGEAAGTLFQARRKGAEWLSDRELNKLFGKRWDEVAACAGTLAEAKSQIDDAAAAAS